MVRKNKKKAPSRIRYEQENPTISCRLDKKTKGDLEAHLIGSGCSLPDFIKQHLAEEKNMIQKRVEMLASKQVSPLIEDRLRCVEDLVRQIFISTVDTDESPPRCPHCDDQELIRCAGRQMASNLAQPWVGTRKCPKCGFFIDTYKRIDPKSMIWLDLRYAKAANKPKVQPDTHEKT